MGCEAPGLHQYAAWTLQKSMQVEAALSNKNSLCQMLFLLPMVSWLTVGLSTRPATYHGTAPRRFSSR